MPKWIEDHDPRENPSLKEMDKETDQIARLRRDLIDIDSFLDPYDREDFGMPVRHPDDLHTELAYLVRDLEGFDSEDVAQHHRQVERLKIEIPKQYAPYYKDQVELFGLHQSQGERPFQSSASIKREMRDAIMHLEDLDRKKERKLYDDIIIDLEQTNELLDLYQKEPLYFTFRRQIKALWGKINQELAEINYGLVREPQKSLPIDPSAASKNLERIDEYQKDLDLLKQLTSEMHDEQVIKYTQQEITYFDSRISDMRIREIAPQEFSSLKARFIRAIEKVDMGDEVPSDDLDELIRQVDELKQNLQKSHLFNRHLEAELVRMHSVLESVRYQNPDFAKGHWQDLLYGAERYGHLQNAYRLLGIADEKPSQAKIKKQFKDQMRLYHPDRPTADPEKATMISTAYKLIKRSWKKE